MATQKDILYQQFEEALYHQASEYELHTIVSQFNAKDYNTFPILFDLIAEKRIDVLKIVFKNNIPFSYKSSAGGNVLHVACGASGSLEAVKFLYENNICTDVNAATDIGETPFLLAVYYDHLDIVEYLLKMARPDLNIRTHSGATALSLAIKNKNRTMIHLLEQYTAD